MAGLILALTLGQTVVLVAAVTLTITPQAEAEMFHQHLRHKDMVEVRGTQQDILLVAAGVERQTQDTTATPAMSGEMEAPEPLRLSLDRQ